jgi:acetylornithine deacetylase
MSHIDTVPGRIAVGETATTISGRGACDAKGQIAAQLCAIDRASAAGAADYACVFVVGEEVDSIGAIAASAHPDVNSEFLLVGEPTGNAFVSRTRGVVECRITAHRQLPPASTAPVDAAIDDLLDDLKRALEPGGAGDMVNIGTIRSGSPPSVAAARAEAALCIRFSDASVLALERLRTRLRRTVLEVTSPPIEPFDFHVPEGVAPVEPMVAFCSDAPLLARKFERIMLFGPGSIAHAHTDTEHIDKADWLKATEVLTTLLLTQ